MATKKKTTKRSNNVDGIFTKPVEIGELPVKKFEKTSKYIDALAGITKKGSWFQIAEFEKGSQANGIAQFLRKSADQLPKGNWVFATRTQDNGKVGLFAQLAK
jgi:hypothetical protein